MIIVKSNIVNQTILDIVNMHGDRRESKILDDSATYSGDSLGNELHSPSGPTLLTQSPCANSIGYWMLWGARTRFTIGKFRGKSDLNNSRDHL